MVWTKVTSLNAFFAVRAYYAFAFYFCCVTFQFKCRNPTRNICLRRIQKVVTVALNFLAVLFWTITWCFVYATILRDQFLNPVTPQALLDLLEQVFFTPTLVAFYYSNYYNQADIFKFIRYLDRYFQRIPKSNNWAYLWIVIFQLFSINYIIVVVLRPPLDLSINTTFPIANHMLGLFGENLVTPGASEDDTITFLLSCLFNFYFGLENFQEAMFTLSFATCFLALYHAANNFKRIVSDGCLSPEYVLIEYRKVWKLCRLYDRAYGLPLLFFLFGNSLQFALLLMRRSYQNYDLFQEKHIVNSNYAAMGIFLGCVGAGVSHQMSSVSNLLKKRLDETSSKYISNNKVAIIQYWVARQSCCIQAKILPVTYGSVLMFLTNIMSIFLLTVTPDSPTDCLKLIKF